MIKHTSHPADLATFTTVLREVQRVVDTDCRLPARPSRIDAAHVDVCQYSHAIEGAFGAVLQALVDVHGDDTVSLVVLEPTPSYYRDNYGSYPAFAVPGVGLSEAYWEWVAHEPMDDPTGAIIYTADVVALTGSSRRWAVWAERSWDIAILMSEHAKGSWLSCGVPFVSAEAALADFTEPDFKAALSEAQRTTFLRNFGRTDPNA